jgi:hypothetical protein
MYVARSQCETCTLHGTCSLCTALARVQTFQGLIPFFYRAKRDHALSEIIDICVCARPSGHTPFALAHAVYNMQRTTCSMQRTTCSVQHAACNMQHAAYNMHHTTSACTYSVVGHSVRSRLTLSRGVADAPQHEIDPIWHVIPCSMVQHTFTSHRRATLYIVCLYGVRRERHSVGTTTWSTQSGARKFRRSRSKSRTSRVLQGHYSKGTQWVLNGYR